MDSLCVAQQAIYQALQPLAPHGCFLRVCQTPDALWITDYPRRGGVAAAAEAALLTLGLSPPEEAENGLWKLDWSSERYQALWQSLPTCLPPYPERLLMEDAYALCRLLLLHSCPLAEQPMELNRRLMKLESKPQREWQTCLSEIHRQCAARLRLGLPLPTLGGRLLAQRLTREQRGEIRDGA